MGDAALPQPTAGGFVPMLGVGMGGSVPGTVAGQLASTRSSAVPQLHNAIVERLRARIELCRRHHTSCESRYQRGQAETSDREHESTLHLLNIVNQGPGHRKNKGNKNAAQQPSEYNSRLNGEQKPLNSAGGETKNSTRIALQGSLRRKIEGQPPGYNPKQNGLSAGAFGPDFKRVRVDGDPMRHGGCVFSNGQQPQNLPGDTSVGVGLQRKDNNVMGHAIGGDLFSLTLKEMKREPGEVHSCGQSSSDPGMMVFDFKEEGDGQIDPELQDLFDELTKSVPSLNDLEFEKMLKQEVTFGVDLGRPGSAGASKPCAQMERAIKTEYPPGFSQAPTGSPQLRPASAGPALSMASTSLSSSPATSVPQNLGQGPQVSSGATRPLTSWTELSHSEQLKQMAANQQPALLHHHQQSQPGTAASWSPAMTTHSSPGPFGQEKIPSPATLCPQNTILPPMGGSQNKGINDCLFKVNGSSGSTQMDMKVLSSKPLSHFSPKSHPSISQQQPKTLPQKMALNPHVQSLHFKLAQQRQQVLPPGVRLPTSSSFGSVSTQSLPQPQPPAPNSQPKILGKNQAMQRQLALQQQIISDSDKINPQDQLSRHLTRPPPDYKQPRRNMVGAQQPNPFKGGGLQLGLNSSQALTSTVSSQSALQANSCHLPTSQATKMTPSGSDRRFGGGPDPSQGGYNIQTVVSQLQQHGSQNQLGLNQNSPRFPGPNSLGGAFASGPATSTQHMRPAGGQEAAAMPRQRLLSAIASANAARPANWAQGSKQPPMGMRRFPSALPPHQGGQTNVSGHHFPPRPMAPPSQVAADAPMVPLNQAMNGQTAVGAGVGAGRDSAPRPGQPRLPPLPTMGSMGQSSPAPQVAVGVFGTSPQNPRSYQGNQSGDLTFDFLQDGDNTVPGINSDSDFIDSLLKSGPSTDDWMKDINLDEILGSQS
ncbi:hypothetical protein MATL_G00043230 [Megalops atlanticus]|uniref:Neurogenic mastermind-like N-terminal domain-containing protein n=1 Tax=Megalops atlanticus TaxID=7932 RepID=A0A9D3QBF1_MEGAT|nr:hypothetical protein MATL_G00043230 [Megalops atlanticus]